MEPSATFGRGTYSASVYLMPGRGGPVPDEAIARPPPASQGKATLATVLQITRSLDGYRFSHVLH